MGVIPALLQPSEFVTAESWDGIATQHVNSLLFSPGSFPLRLEPYTHGVQVSGLGAERRTGCIFERSISDFAFSGLISENGFLFFA